MACDHCGTVKAALTSWTPQEVRACTCQCHVSKAYDRMGTKERKKYWKDKGQK